MGDAAECLRRLPAEDFAALPSTSPGWMPSGISTIGRPSARACSGVVTPPSESTSSGSARPCTLVPKSDTTKVASPFACSPARNAITSARSEVSR